MSQSVSWCCVGDKMGWSRCANRIEMHTFGGTFEVFISHLGFVSLDNLKYIFHAYEARYVNDCYKYTRVES